MHFLCRRAVVHCLESSPLLLPSPVCGHLGCFWFLAIVSASSVNCHVQVSVWTCTVIFCGKYPGGVVTGRCNERDECLLQLSPFQVPCEKRTGGTAHPVLNLTMRPWQSSTRDSLCYQKELNWRGRGQGGQLRVLVATLRTLELMI